MLNRAIAYNTKTVKESQIQGNFDNEISIAYVCVRSCLFLIVTYIRISYFKTRVLSQKFCPRNAMKLTHGMYKDTIAHDIHIMHPNRHSVYGSIITKFA